MKGKTIFNNALFQAIRIEELIGLVLITFTLVFACLSNLYIMINELPYSQNITVSFFRIFASAFFTLVFYWLILFRAENKIFQIIRDFVPFIFVLVIYFNLQDTIFLINPHDIHYTLVNLDGKLFGVQPSVWAEQFYDPLLTDWFALAYLNYYLGLLYIKKQYQNFRTVMLTVMISYFIGFVAYIFFPASSPYLVISELYQIDIWEDTSIFSWITRSIVDLSPYRVRDAFPSMHNAIVLLTLIMAWRYHRTYFWIQLPLAISLPVATVYLRYHYVVDIIGALPVIALALYISPFLEQKWKQFQKRNAFFEGGVGESGVN